MTLTRRVATAGFAAGLIPLALAATASRAEAPSPTVMHSGVFTWDSLAPANGRSPAPKLWRHSRPVHK